MSEGSGVQLSQPCPLGLHQVFTKLASERIGDGADGFVVEATGSHHCLLFGIPEVLRRMETTCLRLSGIVLSLIGLVQQQYMLTIGKSNGCPVNGPAIAADGRRVAVAWFTGANDAPRVKVAFSSDAGATFGGPIEVENANAVGRVDTLLLPDGSALVCWMAGTVESGEIKVRRVMADGTLGPASVIAKTDISRSSGFPRMARLGDESPLRLD